MHISSQLKIYIRRHLKGLVLISKPFINGYRLCILILEKGEWNRKRFCCTRKHGERDNPSSFLLVGIILSLPPLTDSPPHLPRQLLVLYRAWVTPEAPSRYH